MTDEKIVSLLNKLDFYKDTYLLKDNAEEIVINPLKEFLDDWIISPSKITLFFKEYPDYVIKIPLSRDEFILDYKFYNKITPEVNLYNFFKYTNMPFLNIFKPYISLTENYTYPYYKQEKITPLSTVDNSSFPLEVRRENINILLRNVYFENKNSFSLKGFHRGSPRLLQWYVDILKEYDKSVFNLLLMFLQSSGSYVDINHKNIGYDKNNKPAIIDYSLR